jgi:glucose/arabinose dehydrogenase
MRALTTRLTGLSSVGLLSLSLAGCPDNQPGSDTGGVDVGTLADVPGIDAPGADVPVVPVDAPVGSDTGTASCTVTGYPALDFSVFANGFNRPLYMTGAPGTTDLFVVEQDGRILVRDAAGAAQGTFLDISAIVENGQNEQGLLGLAFHPGYATNGLFYVFYTDGAPPSGGNDADNVVAVGTRATDRTANPTVNVILRIPDFEWNHNGGCLQFGPDGELYIGTGDGGGGGDPQDNGQDNTQLLGKILRIHVDPATPMAYTIPASNPFAAAGGDRDEIYFTGLRNPWRFSFDRATGDVYIGDVGQNAWEEINVVEAGMGAGDNFGWSNCEGFRTFPGSSACTFAHHEPVLVTSHSAGDPVAPRASYSITGGYVYRGTAIPGLVGAYLFGDYVGGYVSAFRWCDGAMTEYQELTDLRDSCNGLASFAQDNAGELYMVCRDGGSIRRIIGG